MNQNYFDIIIIGAGITGIFAAETLNKKKFRICLIESGNEKKESSLFNYKAVGHPEGIRTVANYKFGGGHNVWHGLLGRLTKNDMINSKYWPKKLINAYDFVENYLGLKKSLSDKIRNHLTKIARLYLPKSITTNNFIQVPVGINKKEKIKLLRSSGVKVKTSFVVKSIERINNKYFINGAELGAKKIIMAANPIYNAAILLNSNFIKKLPVYKNIGKNLCDHPMGVIGKINFSSKKKFPIEFIRKKLFSYYAKITTSIKSTNFDEIHSFYLVPTLEKNLNKDNIGLRQSLISLRDSGLKFSIILEILKNIKTIFFIIAYKTGLIFSVKTLDILVVSEQEKQKKNNILLKKKRIIKNWNISNYLINSIVGSVDKLYLEIKKKYNDASLYLPSNNEIRRRLTSAAHLACTTSIGKINQGGCVDKNFELYGAKGLYITGSSVFPRATSINNTLTALALTDLLVQNLNMNAKN